MTEATDELYTLYGLHIRSRIALPELVSAGPAAGRQAEVEIRLGQVPRTLDGATHFNAEMQVKGADCIIDIPEVARFRVTDGQRIVIEIAPGAAPGDVRTFLFGVAVGALVHQRGLIPLHLSAVATPYGVWAFTGDSGAGKSTTAGTLNRMTGWPILCDDVAVLDPREDTPLLHTGMRRLKLWNDAVDRFQLDRQHLVRDLVRWEKFHVLAPEIFDTTPRRLGALFVLEVADQRRLDPIRGARAFQTIMNAVYRPGFASLFGDVGQLTRHLARVANMVEVYSFVRPWNGDLLEDAITDLIRTMVEDRARV